jgi:hypothetical protein
MFPSLDRPDADPAKRWFTPGLLRCSDRRAPASVSDQKSTVNDHFGADNFRERRAQ